MFNPRAMAVAAVVVIVLTPVAAATQVTARQAVSIVSTDNPFASAWADDALRRAVAVALEARRKGGQAAGEEALSLLVARHSGDPAERARLLAGYGYLITELGAEYDESLPYLRRAVIEGRAGYASDSRILALLLADTGTLEFEVLGEATSNEAEAMLEESWAIRSRVLGPGHVESLASLVNLADVRGQAARLAGDPARVSDAARLYEHLMSADPPTRDEDDLTEFFVRWAKFHVNAGAPEKACEVLAKTSSQAARLRLNLPRAARQIGLALRDAGHVQQASQLLGPDGLSSQMLLGETQPKTRCG